MKIEDISKYLKIPLVIATGLSRAGFFGFANKSGHFKRKAIIDFDKYGVQWDSSLKNRMIPSDIDPIISGWENPPKHTKTQFCISIDKKAIANDELWVANFFFRANTFYFPAQDTIQYLFPSKIKLDKKFVFRNEDTEIIVYPDDNNRLALIRVYGKGNLEQNAEKCLIKAKNKITPILNWLTMTTDEPLPIVQENLVSLPSGNIHFMTTISSKSITITPEAFTDYKPIQDAQSLYRLGLNTNEPMYAFLSFWRSNEAIYSIEKECFRKYNDLHSENAEYSALIKEYKQLVIPNHPAFGEYIEKKLNKASDELRNKFRNVIAHSYSKGNDYVLTGSDEESNQKMQSNLQIIRYIVKIKIDYLNKIFKFVSTL
jgi:hypothetical protein